MLAPGLVPAASPWWHVASAQGARSVNADAAASFTNPVTHDVAFALADGIGDNAAAARAAQLAAAVAVRAAADEGPVSALLTAQLAVQVRGEPGDCVLVIALPSMGDEGPGYRIGWVGDVRAFAWDGCVLHQLTTDHTVAQYFRDRGRPATARMEHVVTTTVRTVRPAEIGTTDLRGTGALVLTSDGVHKPLNAAAMHAILGQRPPQPAAALVEAAIRLGGSDNATAVVIDRWGKAAGPRCAVPPATAA